MWKIVPLAIIQSLFLAGGQVLLKLGLAASGPFSWSWASLTSASVTSEKSVPFGKYWRSSPLVFSLVPLCQGLLGSQK